VADLIIHLNYLGHHTADINSFDRHYQYDTIINLSCEHMSADWFKDIKSGTQLILQSNNLAIDGHINKCESLEDFKSKYSLSEIKYDNTLKLNILTDIPYLVSNRTAIYNKKRFFSILSKKVEKTCIYA